MNERPTDFELLQRFARAGDQGAFREVVRKHVDLVFATALRKVGEAGGAEEIAQNVFSALARKAWQFAPDDSLPAWLHKTALLESKSWLRGELRRRRREQTAVELGTTMKTPDAQPAINALLPLLDDALLSLREKDRAALLLRFYEKQSLREVGAVLGVSEDSAQKRVQTALEKLSGFFHRRGYKTATVAAAAGALQHSSASVSAVTLTSVANAALQTAPPALAGGLGAVLARLATLTKVQTAVVCSIMAFVPVLWMVNEQHKAASELALVNQKSADARREFNELQSEITRLREQNSRLDSSYAEATASAGQSMDAAKRFEAWKKKIRAELLAADYRWPEDSPFIRIHKSLVPQLEVRQPIQQPGVIKQESRELLGLSPQEREQAEAALKTYFGELESLMASRLVESNSSQYYRYPTDSLAHKVYEIPPLGDGVNQNISELRASLKAVLEDERWQIIAPLLDWTTGSGLRQTLALDSGVQGQNLAVWIEERNNTLVVSYGWGSQQASFSSGGMALSLFLPGAQFPNGESPEESMGLSQVPVVLTRPALAWLREQAQTHLAEKGAK